MISRTSSIVFPHLHLPPSSSALLMCILNTTTNMTSCLSIPGQHVSNCHIIQVCYINSQLVLVLDPQISYEGMKLNYENDLILSEYLESSKADLYSYYETHYANKHTAPAQMPTTPQTPAPSASAHSPQKNFTACFQRKTTTILNELDKYFKLPPEDFKQCNPIHWWMGRRAQFPNLFWFAHDLLCIPGAWIIQHQLLCFAESSIGSAVAVECVFSGGRDTISLHCASLHPETIKVLMLVKKKLHLVRAQTTAALHK
jgi:hypothetical protein